MYRVVECGECGALWIVEGEPETTGCPQCATRHRFESLRPLSTHDEKTAATAARGAILADRSDHGDGFDPVDVADAAEDR